MIYIKNCVSVIPGYDKGKEFGELISTRSLLENMHNPEDKNFDYNFVQERLGIQSVARSHLTLDLLKQALADRRQNKKQYSLCHEHETLKAMLITALNLAFKNQEEKNKVISHIHITGTAMVNHGHFLGESRVASQIANGKYVPTQFLIKGCSGIYDAFLMAEALLARPRRPANILVTADSNLAPLTGQATKRHATSGNINEWLCPAIFAEGVGAAVISNERDDSALSFRLDYNNVDIVTEENRVRATTMDGEIFCLIDAKGVSKTYMAGMAKNIERTLAYAGSFANLDAILMHESNPNLLDLTIKKHKVPVELVPKHSDKIGTLGPVSSFQLLEEAFTRCQSKNRKVALNVIGELFSGVNSGCLGLST